MNRMPLCLLPDEPLALCECRITMVQHVSRLTTTVQHGNNPEHSREFHDRLVFNGTCERGHILEMEEWLVEVVEYAHPENAGAA